METDLSATHENFVEAYRLVARALPGGDVLELPGGCALATGEREPEFNRAFLAGPQSPETAAGAIGEMRAFYAEQGLPWMLIVADAAVAAVQAAVVGRGFVPGRLMPGMVMNPLEGERTAVPGLVIEAVTSAALGEIFAHVLADGFGTTLELARTFVAPGAIDSAGVTHYLGWLDERPVAAATRVTTGRMAGIYNVTTVREARRTGIGTAMTWEAALAGLDEGCSASTLQATVQGFSVYQRMGYRHVTTYRSWYWLDR